MKRMLRIVVLVHTDLVPPDDVEGMADEQLMAIKTEYDVITTLRHAGHTVHAVGISHDLAPLLEAITTHRPHVIFNLMEEFGGIGVYDAHIPAVLELLGVPFTGCNPRGLMLAHNKALSKMVLRQQRVRVPRFFVAAMGRKTRRPKTTEFPLIVKSLTEEGSIGIAQASVVYDDAALAERVELIHRQTGTDAIVEQYIEGRELYIGLLGNHQLKVFTPWEMFFHKLRDDAPNIATGRIKWDLAYRASVGIDTGPATDLNPADHRRLERFARRAYRALGLSGYARMDIRMSPEGRLYLLEANPNPDLSYGEDFAESAEASGLDYPQLLQRLVSLGRSYRLRGQA